MITTGEATWDQGLLLFVERSRLLGGVVPHLLLQSRSRDDDGEISGMLCVVNEETERFIGERRRMATLRDLGARITSGEVRSEAEMLAFTAASAGRAIQRDLPFHTDSICTAADDGSARLCRRPPASPRARSPDPGSSTWPTGIGKRPGRSPSRIARDGPVSLATPPESLPWRAPSGRGTACLTQAVVVPLPLQASQGRDAVRHSWSPA